MALQRVFPVFGLALGIALLGLQMSLTIPARMVTGASLTSSIIFYFSFFTILSNIGVALAYLAALTNWASLLWFCHHQTKTMLAVLIFIVMLVYRFLLAGIWAPVGLFKLADIGLHYAAPITYLVWWATMPHRETIKLSAIKSMMVPPLIYIIYVLVRGQLTGLYPYPFIDVGALGFQRVIVNALGLFAVTAVLMAVFILTNNTLLKFKK